MSRTHGLTHIALAVKDPERSFRYQRLLGVKAVYRDRSFLQAQTPGAHGEFMPGEPYLFAEDPGGYEFEIWFEIPTALDPPAPPRRRRQK